MRLFILFLSILLVVPVFASEIPTFTFQESPETMGKILPVSPRFHREDLRGGYVDFGGGTSFSLRHSKMARSEYPWCRLEYENVDCSIPAYGEDFLFFQNTFSPEMWQKLQSSENIFIHGAEKRESQPSEIFYNSWTEQDYVVHSDRDQTISVRVFPVTDREYITYEQEYDGQSRYPLLTFIDPFYDYKEVRLWRNHVVKYKGTIISQLSDIPEYRAWQEEGRQLARSSLSEAEKKERFHERFLQGSGVKAGGGLWDNPNVEIQWGYSPETIFQKKYMITHFSPDTYTFPDFSSQFMYNDTYVIVPYYEGEIEVHKGENILSIDYLHFLPETGMLIN